MAVGLLDGADEDDEGDEGDDDMEEELNEADFAPKLLISIPSLQLELRSRSARME